MLEPASTGVSVSSGQPVMKVAVVVDFLIGLEMQRSTYAAGL